MPAYVIAETEVTDPERYEQYKAAVPAAIAAGGGRFLVRGGESVVLEGDWQPSRLVVLEFADLAAAKRWYESHGSAWLSCWTACGRSARTSRPPRC